MIFLLIFHIFGFEYNDTTKRINIVLTAGEYTIECFGGQGGKSFDAGSPSKTGGKGAYVKGVLNVTGDFQKFYAYIGGQGDFSKAGPNKGGANGGGSSGRDYGVGDIDGDEGAGGGGGATDLRVNTSKSGRIIVAAGGSGATNKCDGAPGGCLYGYSAVKNNFFQINYQVGQVEGKENGIGENGDKSMLIPGSGAGGGWRGGIKGTPVSSDGDSYKAVASSGSSFISGYKGCINQSMVFTQGVMKPGVNSGDGKMLITINFNCSRKCISCSSANVCLKCTSGYVLHDKKCIAKCRTGYVNISNVCEPCASKCKTCSTSVSSCLTCADGYFLSGKSCVRVCSAGYFANTTTKKCEKCDQSCKTCQESPTKCFSCAVNFSLYNNQCIDQCPNGTVLSGNTCQPCDPSCKTCTNSPSECNSCGDGLYLHQGECVEECPNKFFNDVNVCSSCQSPCETCNSLDKCITCLEGFTLTNGECIAN